MFTPAEIEGKEFVATMRGYDRDEVAAFMRAVAEDVRRLQAMLEAQPAAAAPAPAPEPEPVDLEAVLGAQVADIIRTARAAADLTTESTEQAMAELRAEAERLVADARGEADDLLQEALLRQERIEASNRSTLGALSHVERQMAELRHAFEASFDLTRPAVAALEASSGVTPITSAPSAITGGPAPPAFGSSSPRTAGDG